MTAPVVEPLTQVATERHGTCDVTTWATGPAGATTFWTVTCTLGCPLDGRAHHTDPGVATDIATAHHCTRPVTALRACADCGALTPFTLCRPCARADETAGDGPGPFDRGDR